MKTEQTKTTEPPACSKPLLCDVPALMKQYFANRDERKKIKIERPVRAFNPWPGAWTTLGEMIEKVKTGMPSVFAKEMTGTEREAEGIVARPIETLFDKRMNRVIIKLKSVDFRH